MSNQRSGAVAQSGTIRHEGHHCRSVYNYIAFIAGLLIEYSVHLQAS